MELEGGGKALPAGAGTQPQLCARSSLLWSILGRARAVGRRRRDATGRTAGSPHTRNEHVIAPLALYGAAVRRGDLGMPKTDRDETGLLLGALDPWSGV